MDGISSNNKGKNDKPALKITKYVDISLIGQTFCIPSYPFYIGRANGNDLILRELSVSRTHAKITRSESVLFLHDQGSKYGNTTQCTDTRG